MGTVLAMNMTAKTTLAAMLALAVSACGPLNKGNIASDALAALQTRFSPAPATPLATAPVLTRAQVDANPGGFLVLNAYNGTIITAMTAAASNANRVTWLSADGLSVTTQNGVIAATRGFPRDLMAADVDGVMRALIASGGTTTRTHQILSDTDQIVTEAFQCTLASQGHETISILGRQIPTERFGETCQSDSLAFTNSYWIADDGVMVRSLQAIAPESGYIQLDRP